jgi:hypothetical protein
MDLRAVLRSIRTPGKGKILFLSLLIMLPLFLYLFQAIIFAGDLSSGFVFENFILEYSNPNLRTMFFANYIHNPLTPDHLFLNMLSFIVFGVIIWFFYYYFIPVSGFSMPKNFLTIILILIFFFFPFAISGIAILFYRFGCLPGDIIFGVGFSGVVWAFTGLLLFLLFFVLIMEFFAFGYFPGINGLKEFRKRTSMILFFISFGVMSLLFLILADIGTNSNPFAHFAGFALGSTISALVAVYLDAEIFLHKVSCVLMISVVLLVSSFAWMFV